MINSIVEAISCSLNKEFGDDYEIHNEEIKQGLKEPCFFIACLNPNNNIFLGKRYERTNQFCIQYFPQSAKKQESVMFTSHRILPTLTSGVSYSILTPCRKVKTVRQKQMPF